MGYLSKINVKRRKLVRNAIMSLGTIKLAACSGVSGSSKTTVPSIGNDMTSPNIEGDQWAGGGTQNISADFPPRAIFAKNENETCQLTASSTLGPCYFNPDDFRQDISESELGIPMILAIKLVDESCEAIGQADVDVWHTNAEGFYSADSLGSSDASRFSRSFCSNGSSRALASRWFRGVQTSNAQGIVYFKSCFPGWYPGRSAHIHIRVALAGRELFVCQLGFDDVLSSSIYLKHSNYLNNTQDTMNNDDIVFSSADKNLIFNIKQHTDGSMIAYKTLQVMTA